MEFFFGSSVKLIHDLFFLFWGGGVGCGGEAIRELGNGGELILGGTIDTIDSGGIHGFTLICDITMMVD